MNIDLHSDTSEKRQNELSQMSGQTNPELSSGPMCEPEDKMLCCIPIKTGLLTAGIVIIIYFIVNPIVNVFNYLKRYISVNGVDDDLQGIINEIAVAIFAIPGFLAGFYFFRWIQKDSEYTRKRIRWATALTGLIPVLTFI